MKLADSLPFIERLPQCKSSQQVGVAFSDFVTPCGFMAAACGESKETPEGRSWEFFFNTWPAEWLLQYQQNDYVRHDPVPAMARFSARPFTWLEALAGRVPTEKQREHYDWAIGLGIVDVFAVPVQYPGGDFGGVAVRPSTLPRTRRPERGQRCGHAADAARGRVFAMGAEGQIRHRHRKDSRHFSHHRAFPHRADKEEARCQNPNPGRGGRRLSRLSVKPITFAAR